MSDSTTLLTNIGQLAYPNQSQATTRDPIVVLEHGEILFQKGKIRWFGQHKDRPAGITIDNTHNLGGRCVIPGLIDSHTHLVFAENRINDMALRAQGETYETIAKSGGGIRTTVRSVEKSSEQDLLQATMGRLTQLSSRGVTTVEIKSGYGLSAELELKMLRVINTLKHQAPQRILATALAHVIPKDKLKDRPSYIKTFIEDVLVTAQEQNLISFCDVFVEPTAFSPKEAQEICQKASALGLGIKLHVDQLSDGGGANLAASLNALSADHLEYTSLAGRKALANAGTIATILPGCRLFLGHGLWPDGRALRDAGCEVAIATDANPGSSMILDLTLCAHMAITQCGLSFEEALWGITMGGAKALGLSDRGTFASGQLADFVVIDHHDWRALFYQPGTPPISSVWIDGKKLEES